MKLKIKKKLTCLDVIFCPTEELAKKIMIKANDLGYKWTSGRPYDPNNTRWSRYKENTTYHIVEGQYGSIQSEVGVNIISAQDFLKNY